MKTAIGQKGEKRRNQLLKISSKLCNKAFVGQGLHAVSYALDLNLLMQKLTTK